jgi:hypothetical protein
MSRTILNKGLFESWADHPGYVDHGFYAPLSPLADLSDEDRAVNPANISHAIVFARVTPRLRKLLSDVKRDDAPGGAFAFVRLVPPPHGLSAREARSWGKARWGVDHDAGGAVLAMLADGSPVLRFFTGGMPAPILHALAERYPDVGWRYFACGWRLDDWHVGQASDGEFRLLDRRDPSQDEQRLIRSMTGDDRPEVTVGDLEPTA